MKKFKNIIIHAIVFILVISNLTGVIAAEADTTQNSSDISVTDSTDNDNQQETSDEDTNDPSENDSTDSTNAKPLSKLDETIKKLNITLISSKKLSYSNLYTILEVIDDKCFYGTGETTVEMALSRPKYVSFEYNGGEELSSKQNSDLCRAFSFISTYTRYTDTEDITEDVWNEKKSNPYSEYKCSIKYRIESLPECDMYIDQIDEYFHVSAIKFPYLDYTIPEKYFKISTSKTSSSNKTGTLFSYLYGLQKNFYKVEIVKESEVLLDRVDLQNYTQEGKPIDIIERLSFDIKIPSDDLFKPLLIIADTGETVQCTVEQLIMYYPDSDSNKYYYVLTMKGSKGTQTNFEEIKSINEHLNSPNLTIYDKNVYENNKFIIYNSSVTERKTAYRISGISGDSEINTVYFEAFYWSRPKASEAQTSNIKYEFFKDNYSYHGCRNLYAKFHTDFFKAYPEYRNAIYNPVRDNNGNAAFDLKRYVNFIAQNELKLSPNEKPDWFANLGGGVSATVLGIKRVVNGKEKDTDIMLQLKGSSKTRWFTMERATPSDNLANDSTLSKGDLHYDIVMTAVKSFDGVNVEYYSDNANAHKIGLNILFDYQDGEVLYNGMEFVFDDAVKTVSPENQKYIGGGKSIYDNLFTPLELSQE